MKAIFTFSIGLLQLITTEKYTYAWPYSTLRFHSFEKKNIPNSRQRSHLNTNKTLQLRLTMQYLPDNLSLKLFNIFNCQYCNEAFNISLLNCKLNEPLWIRQTSKILDTVRHWRIKPIENIFKNGLFNANIYQTATMPLYREMHDCSF